MENNKTKEIFDKILIAIFTFLCFIAFFLVVVELPGLLNELFDTTVFKNTQYISFFICVALTGYVLDYYHKKRNEENLKNISNHLNEMTGLNNFWKVHNFKTVSITNMEITSFFHIEMLILNQYSVQIPVGMFSGICNSEDLAKFDKYIRTYLIEILEKQKNKIILEMKIKDTIIEYLKNAKHKRI